MSATTSLPFSDSAEFAKLHLGTARNIKRWLTVKPTNDSPLARQMIADNVHLARLHHRKAMRALRKGRAA